MNPHDIASPEKPVVVIGAGPAGLTAAYELSQRCVPVKILEGDDQIGGLARTVQFKGFWFDIGGHRFFTKVDVVKGLWKTLLGDDLRVRPRMSRIFYRGHFFDYPLKPLNALSGLGLLESIRVMLSYVRVKVSPIRPESSLDEWVSNRFGRRLFSIFFKTYTEKVWGIPCNRISAQWAAQRIKGLSLRTALMRTLFPGRGRGVAIRTLIEEFYYPRLGPGMMWNALCQMIEREGGEVLLGNTVTRLRHSGGMVTYVEVKKCEEVHVHDASHVLSSMPLRDFVRALDPAAPSDVLSAVGRLKYRDFLTVIVIVDEAAVFPDNWIYIHDESVKVGRIQNFKNWSSDMVPDGTKTCLGLEYFCFEGDELWSKKDEELVDLARRELGAIGLVSPAKVLDGTVVRMPKAYPMYDEGYREALEEVRAYLGGFANVQLLGRNGMHKYNNMDHSMLTALLAVRNLFGEQHDLWAINTDEEYHETGGVRDIESGVDLGSREKRTSEGVRK